MTVTELIEKLHHCPPDAEVLTSDGERGDVENPEVWLVDAFRGEPYPGSGERLLTDDLGGRTPNCKAVVISHFGQDGERL